MSYTQEQREYGRKWRQEHPEQTREYRQRWRREIRKSPASLPQKCLRGRMAEDFVAHGLQEKGLEVWWSCPGSKHDLKFNWGGRDWTVQVKTAEVRGDALYSRQAICRMHSDLVALVDLQGSRIRWISRVGEDSLPEVCQ